MDKKTIIEAAKRVSPIFKCTGSFVSTDGVWCTCNTPAKLKAYIESLGFKVVKAYDEPFSAAIVETADGYKIAFNGHCKKM